ncbi:GNAT family N-acetyltransferase [Pedobacter yulinensis]|uniref:GNAT family N-acetyltransferase n=1 Tax=Pedobacter yulinensis TaxID=2126353 RepID=A0A2T3HMF8_9SPHI|nr:GNAT family N-acetyltransferase [Pedobacter yulinensis]PST83593.1 GNAT family N-acetyltransferase [Pedobacter yulinensis]
MTGPHNFQNDTGLPDRSNTGRLLLSRPIANDLDDFFAIFGDPKTNLFNPLGPIEDKTVAAARLTQLIEHWYEHGFGTWTVRAGKGGEVLGFGGLTLRSYGGEQKLNLGYRFHFNSWGKGYATELAIFSLQYARFVLRKPSVWAVVRPGNRSSIRVLEKAGMIWAGHHDDVPGEAPSLLYRSLFL